ncbi:hypothetical protein AAID35_005189 [Escherichia coli]
MKKTLIALAVAASAAVSGSAMAWTANGVGGSVELGGTITTGTVNTPWEVEVGSKVSDLDVVVNKGITDVTIPLKKSLPVLGIRTIEKRTFQGRANISPQIRFAENAVDFSSAKNSVATLKLNVTNTSGDSIGSLTAPLLTGAVISQKTGNWEPVLISGYATGTDRGFGGGLPKNKAAVDPSVGARIAKIYPSIVANFDSQGQSNAIVKNTTNFSDTNTIYSAYYAAGLEANTSIKIILNAPTADKSLTWKAVLPVTVFYQ